mmetsp:Transcript_10314/g.26825  ORF Transcript_10314/g.26825 Transcript_10314/m.26825 type:complete len:283 (+) Transcript_10314:231-1079(+)
MRVLQDGMAIAVSKAIEGRGALSVTAAVREGVPMASGGEGYVPSSGAWAHSSSSSSSGSESSCASCCDACCSAGPPRLAPSSAVSLSSSESTSRLVSPAAVAATAAAVPPSTAAGATVCSALAVGLSSPDAPPSADHVPTSSWAPAVEEDPARVNQSLSARSEADAEPRPTDSPCAPGEAAALCTAEPSTGWTPNGSTGVPRGVPSVGGAHSIGGEANCSTFSPSAPNAAGCCGAPSKRGGAPPRGACARTSAMHVKVRSERSRTTSRPRSLNGPWRTPPYV